LLPEALIASELVGFDVRQHARRESISKRARALEHLRKMSLRTTRAIGAPGFPAPFHGCAQTSSARHAKSAMFSGDFGTCDGSKNRRLRQCKILIGELLISVTLSLRGEVAERLKAAVC
jgi:hypothetical protein